MSTTNRKSARKYQAQKKGQPLKPVSRFQPDAGAHLKAKPTTTKKANT